MFRNLLFRRQGKGFLSHRTFSTKKWYTKSHEWLVISNEKIVTMGITDHAQKALGDIAFVELPEVGEVKDEGDIAVVVESTKTAGEILMPVEGEIQEVNTELEDSPELINSCPENKGWMFKFTFSPTVEETLLSKLISDNHYDQMLKDEDD